MVMAELYEMIKLLDDAKERDVVPKLMDYLLELEKYKKAETNSNQAESFSDKGWRIVGKGEAPEELTLLYITVIKTDRDERTVVEGYMEDDKWFHAEGNSLMGRGLKPVAWLPKDVPEPYRG